MNRDATKEKQDALLSEQVYQLAAEGKTLQMITRALQRSHQSREDILFDCDINSELIRTVYWKELDRGAEHFAVGVNRVN